MSSPELAYAIITPYSLRKSRTGGILARLITQTGLELVGARMFEPSRELIEEYAQTVVTPEDPQEGRIQEMLQAYVKEQLGPGPKTGARRAVIVLLFRGEEAVRKVLSSVGTLGAGRQQGATIRDTFGDLVLGEEGTVRHFEPAVLVPPSPAVARQQLKIWAKYSDQDGGLLKDLTSDQPGGASQRTLVLIKPDNFKFPTGRPGQVMDFFSRTGLRLVGMKLHRMSVAQAMEFYQPVREVLRAKFSELMADRAGDLLEKELGFVISSEARQQLGTLLGPLSGDNQFANIVRFMSGLAPSECDPKKQKDPGTERCIALVYEGADAIRKIREVLGPTDPAKAPPGSIRREFGQNVMVNAAHASDSPENAQREMRIVDVGENTFKALVDKEG